MNGGPTIGERIDDVARRRPLLRFIVERFTPAGRFFVLVLIVAGSVAAGIGIAYPLYVFALFLFAMLLVEEFLGRVFRPKVEVARELPERVAAGARVPIKMRVTNVGRLAAFDLAVVERSPSIGIRTETRPAYLDRLGPGETVELETAIEPLARGSYDLDGPIALSAFPFGIKHTRRKIDLPARLLVYPRFAPLASIDLPVGRKYQPGGLELVSQVGDAGEFCGNREYRSGDRQRDIHHAAWARLGTPVVREFQQEYLCRIALVADTHVPRGARGGRDALEAAISLGAAIADALSRLEYVIDIFAAGPDLYHFQAGRSLAHLDNILDILACVEASRRNPFEVLGPAIQEELAQISTAVLVLLDWDETRERFVRMLESHGVAVKVIVVRASEPTADPSGIVTAAGPVVRLKPSEASAGVDRL